MDKFKTGYSVSGMAVDSQGNVWVANRLGNSVQREHADLVVFPAVADHLAATCKEHEIRGAVPLFDHVQTFVDLSAQRFRMQIPTEETRLDSLAQFGEGLVCWPFR
jgi:hypothetical protein